MTTNQSATGTGIELQGSSHATSRKPVRILLVDDCRIFLDAAKEALSCRPGIEIVGDAESATEALEVVDRIAPDLMLVDLCMPKVSGIELARQMKARERSPKIVITTFYDEDTSRVKALEAGADDFLSKHHFLNGLPAILERHFQP